LWNSIQLHSAAFGRRKKSPGTRPGLEAVSLRRRRKIQKETFCTIRRG
jgi:hypothetical protein